MIHMLRHPFDRTLSQLRMVALRREVEPSEDSPMAMIEESPWLRTLGEYDKEVPGWRHAIAAERLLFVAFGRVRHKPQDLMRQVEDFKGVRHYDAYPLVNQVNMTRPITIPPAVLQHIEERVAPTVEFLRAEFSEEFLQATC